MSLRIDRFSWLAMALLLACDDVSGDGAADVDADIADRGSDVSGDAEAGGPDATDAAADAPAEGGAVDAPAEDLEPGDGGPDTVPDGQGDGGAGDGGAGDGGGDGALDTSPDVPLEDLAGDVDTGDAGGDFSGDTADGGSTWQGLPPFDWSFCPGAETWVGEDDWPWTLEVTAEAVYCKMFDDVEWTCCEGPIEPIIPFTQPERWNDRFELRVPAGDYAVPSTTPAEPIRMPVCVQFADGRQAITEFDAMGSASGTSSREGRSVAIEQPLSGEDGWTANLYVFADTGEDLRLDGSQSFFGGSWLQAGERYVGVQSCTHEGARRDYQTTIALDRGELELFTRIGDSPASTEPGVFHRATGTLDGTSFEQSDRWHLWYEVQHHHFTQYYLVLFDAPIGEVCGLEVLNAVQYAEDLVPDDLEVYEVACEGLAPPEFPLGAKIAVTDYDVVNLAE